MADTTLSAETEFSEHHTGPGPQQGNECAVDTAAPWDVRSMDVKEGQ
jgi:hypothetical protein